MGAPFLGGLTLLYNLIHVFFITLIFHVFIISYYIYSLIEILFIHKKQGSKLKIKKNFY